MVQIEQKREGEFIRVYVDGEIIPFEDIPAFIDEYMRPDEADIFSNIWEAMREFTILMLTSPTNMRVQYILDFAKEMSIVYDPHNNNIEFFVDGNNMGMIGKIDDPKIIRRILTFTESQISKK